MSARAYRGHKSEDQPWSEISVQIPGRVGAQCAERFKKNLNPNIKKTTKWTSTEQKKFQEAIDRYVFSFLPLCCCSSITSLVQQQRQHNIQIGTDMEQRVGLKLRLTWVHERIGSVVFNIKKLSRSKLKRRKTKKLQRRKTKKLQEGRGKEEEDEIN